MMGALSDSVNELRGNPRQWDAFSTEGHCVVLAPPGSGKTKLLTTRMAFDLVNRITQPHGAACITLTNAAAEELRRRVELLGVEGRSTLFIGTVHSFAMQRVIAPFASLVGRPELAKLSIAGKEQIDRAFYEAIKVVYSRSEDTRNVRSTIEVNRQRLATDEDWARHSEKIRQVGRLYTATLREQGLYDFHDVIEFAVEFVERHHTIRQVLTARHPHLYVDEYQDLAPGLHRLVEALCFDYMTNSELFAVGDPDQAVYAFSGTRPELLHELAERSGVIAVPLEHNYRCGEEIIRIANLMRSGKAPITGSRSGGSVSATQCPGGFADQCLHTVRCVRELQKRGVPLHEVAVICPTNPLCQQVATALRSHGLPAFVRGSEYRLTPATTFIEGCAAWATLEHESSNYRLGWLLRRWRTLLGAGASRSDDVALTALLMNYGGRPEERAAQLVLDLLKLGLERALKRPVFAEDLVEVRRMKNAVEAGALQSSSVSGLAERARKVDRVEVTTMTSSKGLEFDAVLILGLDEKWVPHFNSEGDSEKLAEDRRKFYVSVTRARDEVRIFYSGFVVWNSGKVSRAGPSRFLREMGLIS